MASAINGVQTPAVTNATGTPGIDSQTIAGNFQLFLQLHILGVSSLDIQTLFEYPRLVTHSGTGPLSRA